MPTTISYAGQGPNEPSVIARCFGIGRSRQTERKANGTAGLVVPLVMTGQLDRAERRRSTWLRVGNGPGDRIVVGILRATHQAAPRPGTRRPKKLRIG